METPGTTSRPLLFSTLAIVLGIAISLVGSELVLRAANHKPSLASGWMLDHPSQRVASRDLILIPPAYLTESFYATNAGERTVVTIGDSFTESYPVASEDSFPAVLGRLLDRHRADFEVLNAGLGDSGPDQQFRLLTQYVLPRVDPAIVVWTFYPNDVSDNYIRPVYGLERGELVPLDAARNWIYIRTRLYRWTPLPAAVKRHSYLYRTALKALESRAASQVPPRYEGDPEAWSLQKLRIEIARFKELGAQHGFRTYFTLVAPQASYLADDDPLRWADFWAIREYQLLLAELRDQPGFLHARFPSVDQAQIHSGADRDNTEVGARHFNEAGYRLLAELIGDRILRDERSRQQPRVGSPDGRGDRNIH